MNQIFVVMRSSGERSLPLAVEALKTQTPHYEVIEEYPFSEALKKMFLIGQNKPFKYLLALDADVILHEGALIKIEEEAEKFPDLFFLDFFVMDKFRGKCCSGCHLYANHYSGALFKHVVEGVDETRPENHLVLDFAKTHSLICEKSPMIVGLHDFEQYYRDLYSKYFRRALRRKHEAEMLIEVIEQRKTYFPDDLDFNVVLKGLRDGVKAESTPLFDARKYPKIEEVMLLTEKP